MDHVFLSYDISITPQNISGSSWIIIIIPIYTHIAVKTRGEHPIAGLCRETFVPTVSSISTWDLPLYLRIHHMRNQVGRDKSHWLIGYMPQCCSSTSYNKHGVIVEKIYIYVCWWLKWVYKTAVGHEQTFCCYEDPAAALVG